MEGGILCLVSRSGVCVCSPKVEEQLLVKSADSRNVLMHAARGGCQIGVTAVVNACKSNLPPVKVRLSGTVKVPPWSRVSNAGWSMHCVLNRLVNIGTTKSGNRRGVVAAGRDRVDACHDIEVALFTIFSFLND